MIPHNRPTIGIEEESAAIRVLRRGWLSQGKEVQEFENEFCDFMGLPHGHAVALSSGTSSLFLALSEDAVVNSKKDLRYLVKDSQTPKGLNEQGVRQLIKAGFYKKLEKTLNKIHKRLDK